MKIQLFTIFVLTLVLLSAGCNRTSRDELIEEGSRKVQEKNYRGAVVLYKSVLEKDQHDLRARFLLADAYLRAGRFDLAEKELAQVADQDPEYSGLALARAELYLQARKPIEALRELERERQGGTSDAQWLVLRGRALLMEGNLRQAEEALREAARLAPGESGIRLLLAECLVRGGQEPVAREILQQLLRENDRDPEPYRRLAQLATARGDAEEALAFFQRAGELDPADLQSRYLSGLLLLEKGAVPEAERVAEDILRRFPEAPRGLQLKGYLLYLQGRHEESVVYLQRTAEVSPDLLAYYVLGLNFYRLGKTELALTQFQRILDHRPESVQSRVVLAMILLRQERTDEAIRELKRAQQIDDGHALAHQALGSAYLAKGWFDQAMREFDRATELDPNLADAHLQKGLFTLSRGDVKGGEGHLVEALKVAPEIPDIRLVLAGHYLVRKQFIEAERTLLEGLTGRDTDALLYNYLAAASFGRQKTAEAVAYLEKAKAARPDYLAPYYNLALHYASVGDLNRAQRECQEILSRHPEEARAWLLQAQMAEGEGRTDEALGSYVKAKETGQPAGFIGLAGYLFRRQDFSGALAILEEGLRQAPDPRLRLMRAELLAQGNDLEAAAAAYGKVVEENPDFSPAWFVLGTLHEQLGQRGEAVRCYREVQSRETDFVPALNNLAYLYADMPEFSEEALTLAEKANRLEPDNPFVLDTLGYVYLRQGRLPEARTALKKAAAQLPAVPTVHFHLALVHHRLGDREQALRSLRTALELGSFAEAEEAGRLLDQLTGGKRVGKES